MLGTACMARPSHSFLVLETLCQDVFGTDICTCRPYLVYAIQGAAETAAREFSTLTMQIQVSNNAHVSQAVESA